MIGGKLLAAAAPWLKPGLAIAGIALVGACIALWFKADAAAARAEAAEQTVRQARQALADSERANAVLRAQSTAATAVAATLLDEREKDRAIARQNVGRTLNAPITQNSVVPGALPAAIGGLRDSGADLRK